MKKIVKDYFKFSKKELIAILTIFFIVIISILLPQFVQKPSSLQVEVLLDSTKWLSNIASEQDDMFTNQLSTVHHVEPKRFYFDPNTLDEKGLLALGIRPKTVQTILKYRNKGGKFRQPEDLQKIYGLPSSLAKELIPYVRIANNTVAPLSKTNQSLSIPIININSATVEEWNQLPKMYPGLSNRIVKYRTAIGGFKTIESIKKTYGLNDSIYAAILPYLTIETKASTNASSPSLININTASVSVLSNHPQIGKDIAEAIVYYRKKYGAFQSLEDLMKIVFITPEVYQKISPYLTVD